MTVEVHDDPADDDGTAGEGAHGDEVDARVLGRKGVADGDEDGEAGDGEGHATEDEGGAQVEPVGGVGDEQGEDEGGGDGGDGVELGLHGGVAECFDDGGGEVGEALEQKRTGMVRVGWVWRRGK